MRRSQRGTGRAGKSSRDRERFFLNDLTRGFEFFQPLLVVAYCSLGGYCVDEGVSLVWRSRCGSGRADGSTESSEISRRASLAAVIVIPCSGLYTLSVSKNVQICERRCADLFRASNQLLLYSE